MRTVDLLVIGGGPAGLATAQYGARAALKTLLLEGGAFGGQALFIDVLENYPGNGSGKSGVAVCAEFKKQAEAFGAELDVCLVAALEKSDGFFNALLDDGGRVQAKAVVLATGAGHRKLGVEGEAAFTGRGVSYCAACDGPFFKNRKIFVAGGGDAACDEAHFLSRISPEITMLVRRGELRAQKAVARRVMDNPSIKIVYNTRIAAIKGDTKIASIVLEDTKTGESRSTAADAVFVMAGIVPNSHLVCAQALQADVDSQGFVKTTQHMETSIPGLFAAGDVRSSPFRQVVVAAGEGAVAAHAAAEYIARLSL